MTINEEQTIGEGDVATLPAVDTPISAQLAEFREYVNGLSAVDDDDVQERILTAILKATTPQDILAAGNAVPATELLNVPLMIEGIRASESTLDGANDFYLHVDAVVIANNDRITFSCGAQDVCVKLVQLARHGFLPMKAKIEQAAKATKKGYFPLFLRPLNADDEPF